MNRTAKQWLLDLSAIFLAVLAADIVFNHLSLRLAGADRVAVVGGGTPGDCYEGSYY